MTAKSGRDRDPGARGGDSSDREDYRAARAAARRVAWLPEALVFCLFFAFWGLDLPAPRFIKLLGVVGVFFLVASSTRLRTAASRRGTGPASVRRGVLLAAIGAAQSLLVGIGLIWSAGARAGAADAFPGVTRASGLLISAASVVVLPLLLRFVRHHSPALRASDWSEPGPSRPDRQVALGEAFSRSRAAQAVHEARDAALSLASFDLAMAGAVATGVLAFALGLVGRAEVFGTLGAVALLGLAFLGLGLLILGRQLVSRGTASAGAGISSGLLLALTGVLLGAASLLLGIFLYELARPGAGTARVAEAIAAALLLGHPAILLAFAHAYVLLKHGPTFRAGLGLASRSERPPGSVSDPRRRS